MSPARSSLASGVFAFFAFILAAFSLFLIYGGLGLVGTIVWGYNDSQPIVYLVFGGAQVLVGAAAFFAASLVALRVIAINVPGALSTRAGEGRGFLIEATGATLAMLALAFLVFAVAAGFATPSDNSDPGAATLVVIGSLLASAVAGISSLLCLRD